MTPMAAKLKLIVPVLVVLIVGGYLAHAQMQPSKPKPKPKVEGTVYVLPREFLVNLEHGRIVRLNVALVLKPGAEIAAEEGHGESTKPPEGFGTLPQEAVARSIFTQILTGADADHLLTGKGRRELKQEILEHLEKHSDIEASGVLFTDLTVQ